MGNVIDMETIRRRRLVNQLRADHRHWWSTWFLPTELADHHLDWIAAEKLRRGEKWGPVVDRGRENGADLNLI